MIAPVIILRNSVYPHYMYPVLPGLCMIAAAVFSCAVSLLQARVAILRGSRVRAIAAGAVVVALVTSSNALIGERMRLTVPGTVLPLDAFDRGAFLAQHAISSLAGEDMGHCDAAIIFAPFEMQRVFGARSGRSYISTVGDTTGYDLVEAVLDSGRVLKVFYPLLPSTRYVHRPGFIVTGRNCILVPLEDGSFETFAGDLEGQRTLGSFLLRARCNNTAAEYLRLALERYPRDAILRYSYGLALARLGKRESARVVLKAIVRDSPDDTLADHARWILSHAK
jgi:hypothetical protein